MATSTIYALDQENNTAHVDFEENTGHGQNVRQGARAIWKWANEQGPWVSAGARVVLNCMGLYADWQSGLCTLSQVSIVELTGLSERTVRRGVKALAAAGLLQVHSERIDAHTTRNAYLLSGAPDWETWTPIKRPLTPSERIAQLEAEAMEREAELDYLRERLGLEPRDVDKMTGEIPNHPPQPVTPKKKPPQPQPSQRLPSQFVAGGMDPPDKMSGIPGERETSAKSSLSQDPPDTDKMSGMAPETYNRDYLNSVLDTLKATDDGAWESRWKNGRGGIHATAGAQWHDILRQIELAGAAPAMKPIDKDRLDENGVTMRLVPGVQETARMLTQAREGRVDLLEMRRERGLRFKMLCQERGL